LKIKKEMEVKYPRYQVPKVKATPKAKAKAKATPKAKANATPAKAKPTLAKGKNHATSSGTKSCLKKVMRAVAPKSDKGGHGLMKKPAAQQKPRVSWAEESTGDAKLSSLRQGTASGEDHVKAMEDQLSQTASLDEKLAMLRSSDLQAHEKNKLLSSTEAFKHEDWKKINGRYKTACDHDPELQDQKDKAGASKAAHRQVSSAWIIDPSKGDVFNKLAFTVCATQSLIRKDIRQSQLEMAGKWTDTELHAHINSGRITCRQDPRTAEVWEYKDNYNDESSRVITKNKAVARNQSSHLAGTDAMEDMEMTNEVWKTASMQMEAGQCWADTGLEWLY
jgi:hypothetical protein